MASFHDLPQELFIAILEALIHAARPKDHTSILKAIILVSKEWQEISQGAPSLWCTVSSADPPKWVERVLRNSGSDRPLNVRFDRYRAENSRTQVFTKLTVPLVDRWIDLRIDWGPLSAVELALHPHPMRFGRGSPPLVYLSPLFKSQVSSLRSLSLRAPKVPRRPQVLCGQSLRDYTLSLSSVPLLDMFNLFEILPSCSNITLLSIHAAMVDGLYNVGGPPVVMDRLEHIDLHVRIEDAADILNLLQLPAISSHTVIVDDEGSDTESWENLLDILTPGLIRCLGQAEQGVEPQNALEYAHGWTFKLASGSFTLGTNNFRWTHPLFVLSKLGHTVADLPFALVYHHPPPTGSLHQPLLMMHATLRCVTLLRLIPNDPNLQQVFCALIEQGMFPTLRTLEMEQRVSYALGEAAFDLVGGVTQLLEARRGQEDTLVIRNRCYEAEVDEGLRGLKKRFPEAFVFKDGGLEEWWDLPDVHLDEDYEDPEYPEEPFEEL